MALQQKIHLTSVKLVKVVFIILEQFSLTNYINMPFSKLSMLIIYFDIFPYFFISYVLVVSDYVISLFKLNLN